MSKCSARRIRRSVRRPVEKVGDPLLAHTRLAAQHHVGARGRHTPHELEHLPDRRRLGEDAAAAEDLHRVVDDPLRRFGGEELRLRRLERDPFRTAVGRAGRASDQPLDLRVDHPWPPYDVLRPVKCVQSSGDVAARVTVRFDEVQESCRLVTAILDQLPEGSPCVDVAPPAGQALGVGLVEGWRGPVMVALESNAGGGIRRCHPHDPSWQNWPVLEHAIIGNIVPDFPLINKSFNLSYSGHDL